MGFSLKDFAKEAVAQVNFRDGGRTAQTVRKDREAKVAQTLRKKQENDVALQNTQRYQNQVNQQALANGRIDRNQYQQKSNEIFGTNTPQSRIHTYKPTRMTPNSVVRNVFDSNTDIDKQARLLQGQPEMYRDQQIAMGNKRPYENLGAQVVGNTSRFLNTAAYGINAGIETNRGVAAQITGNQDALSASLDRQRNMREYVGQPDSGLLGAGTIYDNPDEMTNLGNAEIAKRIGLTTAGTAAEILPFKINPMKGARLSTRLVANAGVDAGLGSVESVARQYAQTGRVDPLTVLGDAGANAVLGTVPTIGGAGINKLKDPVVQTKLVNTAGKVTPNRIVAKQDKVVQSLESNIDNTVQRMATATGKLKENYRQEGLEYIRQRNARVRELQGVGAVGRDVRPDAPDTNPLESLKQEADTGKVFYHGTSNKDLKSLADLQAGSGVGKSGRNRVYVTENPEIAKNFGENVIEERLYGKHLDVKDIGVETTPGWAQDNIVAPEFAEYKTTKLLTEREKRVFENQFVRGVPNNTIIEDTPGIHKYLASKGYTTITVPRTISDVDGVRSETIVIDKKAFQAPKSQPSPPVQKKPTIQDALEGRSTKIKPTVSDSSLTTSPGLSVSSPRSSGQVPNQEMQQIGKTQLENQTSKAPQSLANNTTNTREVKLNTDRLNPDSGYSGLAEMNKRTSEIVDTLSNKDIQSLAKDAGIDTVTHSPVQIKKKIAEQLNVRQDAVRYMNEAEVARKAGDLDMAEQSMMKAAEAGRISRAQGSELGQQLQARRIIANQLDTPQQRIFKLLDTAGINPETYVNRLRDVDFNDPKQVIEAYRDLVPAKGKDWIDVVRYNSMLSSPLTHAVNAMSNSINVGVVAPLEKTLRGVSDAVGGLFGKERRYAAGEGVAYMTGSARSIKKAADEFMSVLSGKSQIQNLDLNEYSTPLATKGVSGATYKTLSVPTKLLGASDKFFRTLAESGEENALKLRQSKGIKVKGDVKALAEAEGSYRLYQQDTDLKGQGVILSTVDSVTNSIMQLRNKHMVFKFVFPFVKTPSNILKQGIEFSPLGAVNVIGNADKATALTRMAIGTAVFGTAASMIASGDMTWGEPTNADARDRFRAEGKQPYAIRIGGKWVAFNKLPPAFSYPMALTAGIHDAVSKGDMTEETGSKIFEGIAKYGQFLSDQSYAKNIGDTLNAFKGDPDKTVQAVANYPQQLIPFRALTGWIARMSDNTERRIKSDKEGVAGEIDKQVQALMQQYPFLRQKTGTRDYEGTPIPSNNPVLNAFSPIKVTDNRGTSKLDTIRDEYKAQEKSEKAMKDSLKTDKKTGVADTSNSEFKVDSDGKVYANIDGEVKTFDTKELYDKAVKKQEKQTKIDDFVSSGEKTKEIEGVMYLKSDDNEQGYTTKSKVEFKFDKDMQGVSIELDKAKANNDLDTWNATAEKKYNALVAKRDSYDTDTEFDKIDAVNKQLLDLDQESEKYAENGYIKKYGGKRGAKREKPKDYKLFDFLGSLSSTNKRLSDLAREAMIS